MAGDPGNSGTETLPAKNEIVSAPPSALDYALDPFKWAVAKKWTVTLVACYATLIVGINSTAITAAATSINKEFSVSDAKFPNSYWPVTAWNGGAAIAPMVVLPLMENYGMRVGYLITYVLFTLFIIPQAVASNFGTLIVTRFFAGCCGGIVQDVMDGVIADIWPDAFQRSLPVTIYVFSLLFGVTIGPVFGGGILTLSLNWRWIFYIQLIIYGASAPVIFLAFKETRGPVIATKAMKQQQKLTGSHETSIPSALPPHSSANFKSIVWDAVTRPTHLLFTEPVVFFFTLLSALSYGIVFISTQSVTQVYHALYAFPEPTTGLIQSSIAIGEIIGFFACLVQNRIYARSPPALGSAVPFPEARLYMAILGSFLGLAAGLFIYGWTAYAFVPWPVPCIGLALTGFGSVVVMQAIMMYVTDSYAKYAASASAAVCFGENAFAALLPLASSSMYSTLGFHWASSLLGFVALTLGVAPVVLLFKGEAVRRRSRFMEVAAYE